jgi:hypothetical protein
MSYRAPRLLLHSTNEGFSEPRVELSVGGRMGRHAPDAARPPAAADYRRFDAAVDQLAAKTFADVRVSARAPDAESAPRGGGARRPVNRALGARGRPRDD